MSRFFDCAVPDERTRGIEQAAQAARRGQLVVLPTDTVYGLGCDAFSAPGVRALLSAKGRGRDMPVPVLVGSPRTLDGLAATLTQQVRDLVEAFWPGPLTVICREAPSLVWDLGDTGGTVAVRMPLHPVAIELLRAVGPMAVSSANISGHPPAMSLDAAVDQLGDGVDVYLDGGPSSSSLPSTIVDVSGPVPTLVRAGVLDVETIRSVAPTLVVPA